MCLMHIVGFVGKTNLFCVDRMASTFAETEKTQQPTSRRKYSNLV